MAKIGQTRRPFGWRIAKALPGVRKFVADFSKGFKQGFGSTLDTLDPFVRMIPVVGAPAMELLKPIRGGVDALATLGSVADQNLSAAEIGQLVKDSIDPLKKAGGAVMEIGREVTRK
jgi:hypothetical protein